MIRKLMVCGQGDAEVLPGRPSWVVVSIHDPGKPPASLSLDWGAVLRLAFHDKEDEELAAQTGLWRLFSSEQARACRDFIHRHSNAQGVLIHCFAGASRSPAIARALAEMLGIPPETDWHKGNTLVLRRMREAVSTSQPNTGC